MEVSQKFISTSCKCLQIGTHCLLWWGYQH